MVSDAIKHYPVLLKEIISIISPQHGGTFIDCTFGQGGYSKKILEFENTKVIALDRDIESEVKANQLKNKFDDRFLFKNIKFSQLNNLKLKNENIKGIIRATNNLIFIYHFCKNSCTSSLTNTSWPSK